MPNTIRHDSPMPDIIAHFREAASWYRTTGGAVTVEVEIMSRILTALEDRERAQLSTALAAAEGEAKR